MPVYKVEICGVNTSKPLLSNEEKKNCFAGFLKGDREAREQYIKGNLRLVLSVIQRFSVKGNVDDLFRLAVSASSRRLIILILPRMFVFDVCGSK